MLFQSNATDLLSGGNSPGYFVYDRTANVTSRVPDEDVIEAVIAGNGRYVAYTKPAGSPHFSEIYRWDRLAPTGPTNPICVTCDLPTEAWNRQLTTFSDPTISSDGRMIAFLADNGNIPNVLFLRDMAITGTSAFRVISRISGVPLSPRACGSVECTWADNRGAGAALNSGVATGDSTNGYWVSFIAGASVFLNGHWNPGCGYCHECGAGCLQERPPDPNGPMVCDDLGPRSSVYVYNVQSGQNVIVTGSGDPVCAAPGSYHEVDITKDGRFVAYSGNPSGLADIYVWDRVSGQSTLVSHDYLGHDTSDEMRYPSISNDGRYVVFQTVGALVSDDTNGSIDIYVVDRGLPGIDGSYDPATKLPPARVSLTDTNMEALADSRYAWIAKGTREIVFESAYSGMTSDGCTKTSIYLNNPIP